METERWTALQTQILSKAEQASSCIRNAKNVEEVTSSLHCLAITILPHDSSIASGCIYCCSCHENEDAVETPLESERSDMWNAFYRSPAFHVIASILLLDVASNWLPCFSLSLKKHVYDAFFTSGLSSEVVQALVSFLQPNEIAGFNCDAVQSNVERLLHLCLLNNNGVVRIMEELVADSRCVPMIPRIVQVLVSIPDKARPNAPKALSSSFLFRSIVVQLLDSVIPRETMKDGSILSNELNDIYLFVGETFSRICRRGSTDVVVSEVLSRAVGYVKSVLRSSPSSITYHALDSSRDWSSAMGAIKDTYSFEKMAEHLLIRLDLEEITDVEAYWVLRVLFSNNLSEQPSLRALFVDKFLLWKVLPLRCGRWIIQFVLLQYLPEENALKRGIDTKGLQDFVQQAATVWSKREFVQAATLEQQTYVTALLGLSLQLLTKEELESSNNTMHAILHGVGCRLESPVHITRKMASCIALVFSKVIDPKNPLYLDDMRDNIPIDWEFGVTISGKAPALDISDSIGSLLPEIKSHSEKRSIKTEEMDPDDIIDPGVIECYASDVDDTCSEGSHCSDDSSLQPYDLADDDSDLKLSFSNLADVTAALRKSDDPDGVERALQVAERLVRGSPDELQHIAGDLTRALIHLRCSDISVEGEEDSAEQKRQNALVALLTTSPFQSVQVLNKLLYSPNLDISQRLIILDVMADAAQELAATTSINPKTPSISAISEAQPWSLPPNSGPPGTGPWKQVSDSGNLVSYSYHYERELPPKSGSGAPKRGKSRKWSAGRPVVGIGQTETVKNRFPVYAASFMLPAMEGFDKKKHGVDLFERDYIVLGKLVYMLGVCMNCVAVHPESTLLAPPLLDMLKVGNVHGHKEAYVRRAALFAASSIVASVHPSYVASALKEGNVEICLGIEWIRKWALRVAESDSDKDCYAMAIACLRSHSEMALQVSRAFELQSPSLNHQTIQIPNLNTSISNIKLR